VAAPRKKVVDVRRAPLAPPPLFGEKICPRAARSVTPVWTRRTRASRRGTPAGQWGRAKWATVCKRSRTRVVETQRGAAGAATGAPQKNRPHCLPPGEPRGASARRAPPLRASTVRAPGEGCVTRVARAPPQPRGSSPPAADVPTTHPPPPPAAHPPLRTVGGSRNGQRCRRGPTGALVDAFLGRRRTHCFSATGGGAAPTDAGTPSRRRPAPPRGGLWISYPGGSHPAGAAAAGDRPASPIHRAPRARGRRAGAVAAAKNARGYFFCVATKAGGVRAAPVSAGEAAVTPRRVCEVGRRSP